MSAPITVVLLSTDILEKSRNAMEFSESVALTGIIGELHAVAISCFSIINNCVTVNV